MAIEIVMKSFALTASTMIAVSLLAATFSGVSMAKPLPKNTIKAFDTRNLTVLAYHEVTSEKNALIPDYAVTTQLFQSHLDWLKKNGYHFITVDQLVAAQKGQRALSPKSILLTFDDGYESFYRDVFPILQKNKIPALLAVVGSWIEPTANEKVHFGDAEIARDKILSWTDLKAIQNSGLVEIGSHSYNLHRGILGNPQGNSEPAAITRLYDDKSKKYESDRDYVQRIQQDLKKNNQLLQQHGIKSPRVMVWPYGRYNQNTVSIAQQLGMPLSLSLDDQTLKKHSLPGQLNRILVQGDMTADQLAIEIYNRQMQWTDQNRPQKVMHVDLDYIYDPDPVQQEKNLGLLLDRIDQMGVNTVYLQAFSDPDGNGSADLVYFPNRFIPMRADLFNRVSWQIQTRTSVGRVYAWMPVYAWELPKNNAVAKELVVTQQAKDSDHLNMGYQRLSPFSEKAKNTIKGIYEDLAKSSSFNGLIFHDDATLSDYEDASPAALNVYKRKGLPMDLKKIRGNEVYLQKWTALKTRTIDDFAMQLAEEVRLYQPFLMTARNLYAQVALNAYSENWYAQSLEESLKKYDFTAIMAMPYMEQAEDPNKFYNDIVNRVAKYPNGFKKTIFELQSVNWRNNKKVPSTEMADTIRSLYKQGVIHVGYYPDNPIEGHPDPKVLRPVFDIKPNGLVP